MVRLRHEQQPGAVAGELELVDLGVVGNSFAGAEGEAYGKRFGEVAGREEEGRVGDRGCAQGVDGRWTAGVGKFAVEMLGMIKRS